MGNLYRDLHAEHGVDLHFGTGVRSLVGNGAVAEVRLTDGTVLPADLVVVGVGVTPRTELAETAGLAVDNGIVVDQYLATSAPGVYAAGDVANSFHPLYGQRVRLEHWSAALNQGPVAAKNMLGKPTVYDKVPYFFSDQYDFGMEYTGYAPKWDELVFRGSLSPREFIAFWLYEGRAVAGMNANIWDVASTIEALVRGGQVVDRAMLVDTEVDLASLVAPPHG